MRYVKPILLLTLYGLLTLILTACGGGGSQQQGTQTGGTGSVTSPTIGARQVESTPVEQGTLFAAVNGSQNSCSHDTPCSIQTAFAQLEPGDILFLQGGTYDITSPLIPNNSGLVDHPISIESYPGETAILEGHYQSAADVNNNPNGRTSGIRLGSSHSYITIRNIEAKHMGWAGISVYGSHNIVEGCHVHHNMLCGIALYGGEWHEDDPDYQIPYPQGYNIIRDNISNANSDVGLPADGGNSDGIAISSGRFNTIVHNTVYANSDDGIDTWRSNDSYVAFNRVYDNGRGAGNGNGIKAGGNLNPDAGNGLRTTAEHNLVYDNQQRGLDYNAGRDVVFRYNTSWNNGTVGVNGTDNTLVQYNIASDNGSQDSGLGTDNSWNIQEFVTFLSTDPDSDDFLRPEAGSVFADLGAYADLTAE